jgi:hypothetical protein
MSSHQLKADRLSITGPIIDLTSIILVENLFIKKAAARQMIILAIYKYLNEKAVRMNSLILNASADDSI